MSESLHPEADARMVDVSDKAATRREARATCLVKMSPETRDLVARRSLPKGDALEVARVAGIMAAKRTAELIPLCHAIAITSVEVDLRLVDAGVVIETAVATTDRTGVEMEALTAAAVAALTIYDMVKGVERGIEIVGLKLLRKSGGRSGEWAAE